MIGCWATLATSGCSSLASLTSRALSNSFTAARSTDHRAGLRVENAGQFPCHVSLSTWTGSRGEAFARPRSEDGCAISAQHRANPAARVHRRITGLAQRMIVTNGQSALENRHLASSLMFAGYCRINVSVPERLLPAAGAQHAGATKTIVRRGTVKKDSNRLIA
jgi:hypothetical protein